MSHAHLPYFEGDPDHLRTMFASCPSGVAALLAEVDSVPVGIIASSLTVGVSIEPPLITCAIRNLSKTWPILKRATRLGVTVMGEDQGPMARQIASRTGDDRFTDIPLRSVGSDSLFIAGAPVWFECELKDEVPAGDHVIAFLEIKRGGAEADDPPLIFYGSKFRQLKEIEEAV